MSDPSAAGPKGVLDPRDRFEEIVFGLIMVLTFSCSLSVADAERADVRGMIIGALGCNLAWGIIDARLLPHRRHRRARPQRPAPAPGAAGFRPGGGPRHRRRTPCPPLVAESLAPQELERVRASLAGLPEPASRVRLTWADALGAPLGLPPGLPLDLPGRPPVLLLRRGSHGAAHLERSRHRADLRASFKLAQHSGLRPFLTGAAMVGIGVVAGGARHRARRLTPAAPRGPRRSLSGFADLGDRRQWALAAARNGNQHRLRAWRPPGESPRSIRPAAVGAPSGARDRGDLARRGWRRARRRRAAGNGRWHPPEVRRLSCPASGEAAAGSDPAVVRQRASRPTAMSPRVSAASLRAAGPHRSSSTRSRSRRRASTKPRGKSRS